MTYKSRGFTLIELLVVIAIIGILSAVVLASLSTARQKGNDAAIQSNLATIQVQAEIYYGNNGNNYGAVANTGACNVAGSLWLDTTIANAVKSAQNSANGGAASVACQSKAAAYAISAKLNSPAATTYWCLDSTGAAGTTSVAVASTCCAGGCP